MELTKEMIQLANLLTQIMVEDDREMPSDYKISDEAIRKTAMALQAGLNTGRFKKDSNGMYYYVGMIDDYGGYIEREIEKSKVETGK